MCETSAREFTVIIQQRGNVSYKNVSLPAAVVAAANVTAKLKTAWLSDRVAYNIQNVTFVLYCAFLYGVFLTCLIRKVVIAN